MPFRLPQPRTSVTVTSKSLSDIHLDITKFGFQNLTGLVLEGVPPEVFFGLSFDWRIPSGSKAFHEAFMADG